MAMNEFRYLQLYVKCMKIFGRCPLQRTAEEIFGSAGGLDILYNVGILHIQTSIQMTAISSFA